LLAGYKQLRWGDAVAEVGGKPRASTSTGHSASSTRPRDRHKDAAGAGTLIRGGTARGGPAVDKAWRQGPLGMATGEGQRRWESSGVEDVLGEMPRLEFMLRFTLSHPALCSAIVGTSNVEHLRGNLAIAEKGPLPDDFYEEARNRLRPAVP
jgi:aryl-alcohol dehydrogenase-like predicted oxidoreductase